MGFPIPCVCDAYKFPHRHGGGACPGYRFVCECGTTFREPIKTGYLPASANYNGWDDEDWNSECPSCGDEYFTDMEHNYAGRRWGER